MFAERFTTQEMTGLPSEVTGPPVDNLYTFNQRQITIPELNVNREFPTVTFGTRKDRELYSIQLGGRDESVTRALQIVANVPSNIVTLERLYQSERQLFGEAVNDLFIPPRVIVASRTNSRGQMVPVRIITEGNHRVAAAKFLGKSIEGLVTHSLGNLGDIRDTANISHLQESGHFPSHIQYLVGFNAVSQDVFHKGLRGGIGD